MRSAFPNLTGMLVVTEVQPGSPSEGVLEPGDVIVRLNGRPVAEFNPLEQVLDENVGNKVEMEAQRGGIPIKMELQVQDLHSITPAAYVEFGEAVVHELSYQQARHFNMPVRGVYIANPGYVFGSVAVPRGAVIQSVNGKPMESLPDFERVITALGEGERATVRFFTWTIRAVSNGA